jgi:hypothetical protein
MADAVRLALRQALRGVHRLTPAGRAMVVAFGDAVAASLYEGDRVADDVCDMFEAMMRTQTQFPMVPDRLARLVLLGRLGTVPLREALVVTGVAVPALLHAAARCLCASVKLVFQCYAAPKLPVALLGQVDALMEACLPQQDRWEGDGALHACVTLHSVTLQCAQGLSLPPGDDRADMFIGGLGEVVRAVYSIVPLSVVLRAYADLDRLAAAWAALGPALDPPSDLRRHACGLMVQLRP